MKGLTFFLEGGSMKKKIPVFVASTVAMSMILGACGYQKDEPQANAKGDSGKSGAKRSY